MKCQNNRRGALNGYIGVIGYTDSEYNIVNNNVMNSCYCLRLKSKQTSELSHQPGFNFSLYLELLAKLNTQVLDYAEYNKNGFKGI